MRAFPLLLALLLLLPSVAVADLILTEVYYDHVGGDDGFEWVEIANTSAQAVDLGGYFLAWGGTDYGYGALALQGSIDSCGIFVVGLNSVAENGAPVFDQAADFDPDLQNSGTAADAVALFAPGADPLSACPLDAVIYGPANGSGLVDETCAVGAVDVDDAPSGSSIERTSRAGDWIVQAVPDPNAITFDPGCGQVPAALRSWGAMKASWSQQR